MLSRRHFLTASAATFAATRLRSQTAHIDVAEIERSRILADAKSALTAPVSPVLMTLSQAIATLTAAFVLTKDQAYAERAAVHLKALPQLTSQPNSPIVDLIPLAEIAVALRFLVDSLPTGDLNTLTIWFGSLQGFLNTNKTMTLERDRKDHRASAWLLLSSAIARSQRDDQTLDANRRLFRKPTLRNQITMDGKFPEELATPNPYRNTLFNFDLLAAVCQLLASPFDLLWDYELPDGPGMRSAAAFVYPVIQDRNKWPAVSDAEHFHDLPGRRHGLLFAGRAYNRPEYVALWRSLSPEIPEALATTFPIRQPLLWVQRAAHGL